MSLHDELVGLLDYQAFCIAVLIFLDMEPEEAIVAKAKPSSKVPVLWGTDALVERLKQIAAGGVYNLPDEEDVRREVNAVPDGQVRYEPAVDGPSSDDEDPSVHQVTPESRMAITACSITMQHVDKLNGHTVSGWNPDAGEVPGFERLRPKG